MMRRQRPAPRSRARGAGGLHISDGLADDVLKVALHAVMRAQSFVKEKPRSGGAAGLMRRVKSGEFFLLSDLRKGRFEVGDTC